MLNTLIRFLPARLISFCGQLQFKVPFLRRGIGWLSRRIVAREGVIQRGIGKGLRFDATGGYPGYLLGTSEPEEQALLSRLLAKGAVFYDIGANIGFYATLAARLVGEQGRVFAFEPLPASAEACCKNARINGFKNVTVLAGAVGAQSETATLALGESSAMHRLGVSPGGLEVPVYAIDAWRKETSSPAPDVVMLDIEGAEIDALRGMMETIRESRPDLMVEVHWLGEEFSEFVRTSLLPLGYRCKTYEGAAIPVGPVRFHAFLTARENQRVQS